LVNDSPTPLTDQAVARLRKLAEGNSLSHEQIHLFGSEEQIYAIQGTLTLRPQCDIQTGRYPGPARGGKRRTVLPSLDAMYAEVQRRKKQFQTGRGWIDACIKELKTAPGEGWGLENAHITLPEQSVVLTASTGCPACNGQRMVTCQQCHGQGTFTCSFCHGSKQETCYACGGTGHNPQNPNQPCAVCNGRRFSTCRHCQGTGQTTCPTCHGRRGTPCPTCKGSGLISEEIGLECGAETQFKLNPEGLPSGLRNALGRLGIANLVKGHADIIVKPPEKDENAAENDGKPDASEDDTRTTLSHDIVYEAKLPYADLRMNLNGHKAVVSAFGKRGSLLGVPTFLDDALKPARAKLAQAVLGTAPLEDALQTRAIGEALQLELGGKGTVQEFRRLYSVGMSQDVMKEILRNLHLALKKQTLITRSVIAALCAIASAACYAGIFLTSFHADISQNWTLPLQAVFDLGVLLLPVGFSWLALNFATRATLQRRFHNHNLALTQKIGKIGYAMFAAIVVAFVVVIILTPIKPLWLLALHR
jgi:hypothetical protein